MKIKNDISPEELRRIFKYDFERDVLVRVEVPGKRVDLVGDVPGSPKGDGYLVVRVRQRNHGIHRIIWTVVNGRWPVGEIDHIDGDKANNKIANLREATRSQNVSNTVGRNKTGFKGVRFTDGVYRARINAGGKRRDLGSFATPEAAHKAYYTAAVAAFGQYAHGAGIDGMKFEAPPEDCA